MTDDDGHAVPASDQAGRHAGSAIDRVTRSGHAPGRLAAMRRMGSAFGLAAFASSGLGEFIRGVRAVCEDHERRVARVWGLVGGYAARDEVLDLVDEEFRRVTRDLLDVAEVGRWHWLIVESSWDRELDAVRIEGRLVVVDDPDDPMVPAWASLRLSEADAEWLAAVSYERDEILAAFGIPAARVTAEASPWWATPW